MILAPFEYGGIRFIHKDLIDRPFVQREFQRVAESEHERWDNEVDTRRFNIPERGDLPNQWLVGIRGGNAIGVWTLFNIQYIDGPWTNKDGTGVATPGAPIRIACRFTPGISRSPGERRAVVDVLSGLLNNQQQTVFGNLVEIVRMYYLVNIDGTHQQGAHHRATDLLIRQEPSLRPTLSDTERAEIKLVTLRGQA